MPAGSDSKAGGRGGIRTHGTLAGTPVFKTGALNHSATLPATRDQAVSRSKVKNDAGTEVMLATIAPTPPLKKHRGRCRIAPTVTSRLEGPLGNYRTWIAGQDFHLL